MCKFPDSLKRSMVVLELQQKHKEIEQKIKYPPSIIERAFIFTSCLEELVE